MRKRNLTFLVILIFDLVFSSSVNAQNCLDFDGVNDYCAGVGTSLTLSNLTLEVWVNHNSLGNNIQRYVTFSPELAVLRYDGVASGGTGLLHFYVKKANGVLYGITSTTLPTTSEWTHIAATYDGTNIKLYMNGQLLESGSSGLGLFNTIGGVSLSASGETMNGQLDEIRIWNIIRSQTEIYNYMNIEISGTTSGLIHYWKLDEGSGLISDDFAGSVDLTLMNMDNSDWLISTAPLGLDFCDAPLPYPVSLAENGARHQVSGPTLGVTRDYESEGIHTVSANGDGADEDGVSNWQNLIVGKTGASVTVNVQGGAAKLDAWIDWNQDGTWGSDYEQIASNLSATVGDNILSFDVPSWALAGNSFARFRLSSNGEHGLVGKADDGEVEDYQITVSPATTTGTAIIEESNIAIGVDGPQTICTADFNGDGHTDVLAALFDGDEVAWFENNGAGLFTPHSLNTSYDGAYSVQTADIDGDGDLDALSTAFFANKTTWYENNGSGTFTTHDLPASASSLRDVLAADLNNDGDMDVVVSSASSGVICYTNNGSQGFGISGIGDGNNGIFATDVDGDGDMDLLSSESTTDKIYWHENNGNTSPGFIQHEISSTSDGAVDVFVTDLDGDGDMDVLSASFNDNKITWHQNDGSENFTASTISDIAAYASSVFATDFDGDGDIDVFSASKDDNKIAYYQNNGSENFRAINVDVNIDGATSVCVADMNGDGNLDLLGAAYNGDLLKWYSQKQADFGDAPFPYPVVDEEMGACHRTVGPTLGSSRDQEANGSHSTTAGGDGADEDGVSNWQNVKISYLGASVTVNVQGSAAKLDAWIDWNQDGSWGGHLDQIADNLALAIGDNIISFDVPAWAVPGTSYARFRLSTQGDLGITGSATDGEVEDYQISINPPDTNNFLFYDGIHLNENWSSETINDIKIIDLDEDGDLDIVYSNYVADLGWMENDGNLNFSNHLISGGNTIWNSQVSDVDGDGDIDVVSTDVLHVVRWHENDGNENFTSHTITNLLSEPYDLFVADMDMDGDMDVIATSDAESKINWYENNGNESFSVHAISTTTPSAYCAIGIDLDNDGDLDIIASSEDNHAIYWFENNGAQSFSKHVISSNPSDTPKGLVATDFDNDGDIDIANVLHWGGLRWFKNDGNENFTELSINTSVGMGSLINIADMNGDGNMDILSSTANIKEIGWYEYDGNGGFIIHTLFTEAINLDFVSAADMDKDGDLDLITVTANKIFYHENGSVDRGDAPSPYPTLKADNGAQHYYRGIRLGSSLDSEAEGQPATNADGDDSSGIDDEDGVSNWQNVQVGKLDASVMVNVQGGTAKLDAWIDWNRDGSWGGSFEQIANSLSLSIGSHTLFFDVPSKAKVGSTVARFRISEEGNLGHGGISSTGEVEDYQVSIAPPGSATTQFSPVNIIENGTWFMDAITTDFDDDGDIDMISGNNGGAIKHIIWYENDGNENFSSHIISSHSSYLNSFQTNDMDGDGDLDMVISYSDTLTWIENDGNQSFTPHLITGTATATRIVIVDLDGDGDKDILHPSYGNPLVCSKNDGNGNFSTQVITSQASGPDGLDAVDMDNDGDMDILSAYDELLLWYENNGSQNYTSHTIAQSPTAITGVMAVDMDNDGDMDALSLQRINSKLIWYENNGSESFSLHTISLYTGSHAKKIFAVDIDGDGDVDVITDDGDGGETLLLFENNGSENFSSHILVTGLTNVSGLSVADINGDGDLDIVYATHDSNIGLGWLEHLKIPKLSTSNIINITATTASCGGEVLLNGGYTVTARGVCWNTTGNPTTSDNCTIDGTGTGSFTSSITGLITGLTYYVRSYATSSQGTGYGEQKLFFTPIPAPGNALDFDGFDEHVSCGINACLDIENSITIEAWINSTSWKTNSWEGSIVSKEGDNITGYALRCGDNGKLNFTLGISGVWQELVSGQLMTIGEWNHVAGTYDGSSLKIYINGESAGSQSVTGAIGQSNKSLCLGMSMQFSQRYFHGKMDEVRIWNSARTEAEIRNNMHNTLDGNETNLDAYYRFDHGSGSVCDDLSANNNDALCKNMDNNNWAESGAIWKRWETSGTTDWSTTTNWSTTFSQPSSADMVLIQSGGTQPAIANDPATPAICNELKIESGAVLTVNPGKALTVSDSILNEAGTSGIFLKSTESGTASLIHETTGVEATVERYIPQYAGNTGWHYVSSPVSSQAIQPEFVADPPTSSDDFYKFSEPDYLWLSAKDNSGNWNASFEDNFVVGRGYNVAYAENETKSFVGELNVGDFTFDESTIPAITYTSDGGIGWNLMGNPYPSGLDWNECSKTNIDASVYAYDGDKGQYVSWNGSIGALSDGIIPTMNGFFIKASANPKLIIPNSAWTHSVNSFYKEKDYVEDLLVLKVEGNGFSDKTFIHFKENATLNFDSDFDAYKLSGISEAPQLYSKSGETKFSINVLPYTSDEMVIPLSLKVGNETEYTISVSENSFWETVDISLKDLETGNIYNLRTNNSITINQSTTNPDRFLLLINGATGIEAYPAESDGIEIYSFGDQIFIKTDEPSEVKVSVYNILGQTIESRTLTGFGTLSELNTGFYLVVAQTGKAMQVKKVFVR